MLGIMIRMRYNYQTALIQKVALKFAMKMQEKEKIEMIDTIFNGIRILLTTYQLIIGKWDDALKIEQY